MAMITAHAIQRYQERFGASTKREARAAIETCARTIDKAADFGCSTIVMGNGAVLKLKGDVVATVLPKGSH